MSRMHINKAAQRIGDKAMTYHLYIIGDTETHYFGAFETYDEAECEGVHYTSGTNMKFEIKEDPK